MLRYLIALILCLAALPAQASTYFDTDFETCALGTGNDFPCEGWNDFLTENVNFERIVSGLSFTGSKSMRQTFDNILNPVVPGGGNTIKPSIHHRFGNREHVFLRVALQLSAGFQICDNGNTKLIRLRGDNYPIVWLMYRYGAYEVVMEDPYDSGTYVISSGIAPRRGSWDQVEVEYKLNTPGQSNGLIRLWVNGTLRAEQLNKAYRGPTPTSKCNDSGNTCASTFAIYDAQVYAQCGLGTIHYDRIAVGDARIGLVGGTPPPQDTTKPNPPTNLMVQ